jgi:hypothetical protein
MDILFYVFAGGIAIATALATIAIWAPRPARLRVLAVVITTLFIPVVYLQLIGMLSKPKPMSFEWYERSVKKATVLGISLHEEESIYLWLRPEGSFRRSSKTRRTRRRAGIRPSSSRTRFTGEAFRNGVISTSRSFRRRCRR